MKKLDATNNDLRHQVTTLREDATRKMKLISTLKVARSGDTNTIKRLQDENKDIEENMKRFAVGLNGLRAVSQFVVSRCLSP